MRIVIATPVKVGSTRGNGVTARRWQRLLSELGHETRIQSSVEVGEDCDVLVALHARRSAPVIAAFAKSNPARPIVLALTGTDLYGDLPGDAVARASIRLADHIVVLQPAGLDRLPAEAYGKAHVILQSIPAPQGDRELPADEFAICVLAHLRRVKDPLRAARAAALLPATSRIHVTLAGAATDEEWALAGKEADERNPRFTWLGELSTTAAARLLESSHALVVSSILEGGANVVSEAIVAGVPVLATRIEGNTGLLGPDYPGYFPAGDVVSLAELMLRTETEPGFRGELRTAEDELRPRFHPDCERAAWAALLADLS